MGKDTDFTALLVAIIEAKENVDKIQGLIVSANGNHCVHKLQEELEKAERELNTRMRRLEAVNRLQKAALEKMEKMLTNKNLWARLRLAYAILFGNVEIK